MGKSERKEFDVRSFIKRRKVDLFFLLTGLFLGVYFDWTIVQVLIFLVFIWSLLGPIRSRYLAVSSLFLLGLTATLLLLEREERAEDFAIYAYYFLAMAVIRAIIEVRSEEKA